MPFMKGRAPVRYTRRYLEAGRLLMKDSVRIMTINYNTGHKPSKGAYDFIFWHLPQLQYKNPDVQFLVFKNMTPTPFLKVYLAPSERRLGNSGWNYHSDYNGKTLLSQLDEQPKDAIFEHVKEVFCKSSAALREEALVQEKKSNSANFGIGCRRECICEIPGQAPCTMWVTPPKEQRGKYQFYGKDVQEDS